MGRTTNRNTQSGGHGPHIEHSEIIYEENVSRRVAVFLHVQRTTNITFSITVLCSELQPSTPPDRAVILTGRWNTLVSGSNYTALFQTSTFQSICIQSRTSTENTLHTHVSIHHIHLYRSHLAIPNRKAIVSADCYWR